MKERRSQPATTGMQKREYIGSGGGEDGLVRSPFPPSKNTGGGSQEESGIEHRSHHPSKRGKKASLNKQREGRGR